MKFHIGIDLGTTNCALAAVAASDPTGHPHVLDIIQADSAHSVVASPMLPSCLYLDPSATEWSAGRWARARAAETPDRVILSAKSWLIHHAADRRAGFLPLGSKDIPAQELLSPVAALARLLGALKAAWDAAHPEAPLAGQDLAITVPASFDPAAQQLTLEAAQLAGFPSGTILMEEPQAAFYSWMESDPHGLRSLAGSAVRHLLVVDLGGGTTDLSLFRIDAGQDFRLRRIAVSNHLLLGGDNLDLALAHVLEARLAPHSSLPPSTFAQLLARSRDIKEQMLGEELDDGHSVPVAVVRPGSSLLSGTLQCDIAARDVRRVLLEGFFPDVGAGERPIPVTPGLREMGLPYAKDPAITRHIADFLRDRSPVDAVLFNGGLTKSPAIRKRILDNIERWQGGRRPDVLSHHDPDLSVACGAAHFLHLKARNDPSRIEAGASRSYYISAGSGGLLCVLPMGTPPEQPCRSANQSLRARVAQPATFQLFSHARRPDDKAGDIIPPTQADDAGFRELPAIESILTTPAGHRPPRDPCIRVQIRTTLKSTGILSLELVADDPNVGWKSTWPLAFSLRPPPHHSPHTPTASGTSEAVMQAATQMEKYFSGPRKPYEKLTANALFLIAEKVLRVPKSGWTGGTVRQLFDEWIGLPERCAWSNVHEEAWLHVAGFLLRPGCGMSGDDARTAQLVNRILEHPQPAGQSVWIQRWIAARRIAAGLTSGQAARIWERAESSWKPGGVPSGELVLLAGALESLPADTRTGLGRRMVDALKTQPNNPTLWKSLGRLLSRVLFHAGTDQVLPPSCVEEAWEALRLLDIGESVRPEATVAWLRAARLTGLRPLDISPSCRNQIQSELKSWGITDVRRRVLSEVVPLAAGDQASLLGESPPPGILLASS